MNYTEEQTTFVKTALKGQNIACSSFAGTGKSFALFLYFRYAKQKKPDRKHLLLSFNRHLQREYEQDIKKYSLYGTVETKTLHVLAKRNTIDTSYVYVGDSKLKIKKPKLTNLHGYDLLKNCNYNGQAWEIYKEFYVFNTSTDDWTSLMVELYTNLLSKGLCSHDMYVKLFQLGLKHNHIDLSKQYDCICLDEINDASEVLYGCYINSGIKQKIGVGDIFQDLYSFLTNEFNAVVELLKREEFTNLNLSKTFRCSHKIASTVNQALLKPYMNSTVDYIGTEEPDLSDDSVLIVTTTNSDVLLQAYVNARQGIKYSLAASVKELSSELVQVYVVSVIKRYLESATMKNLKQVEALLSDIEQTYRDKGSNFVIVDALSKEIKKDLVGYYWYKKRNGTYDLPVIEYLKSYSQLNLKGSINLLGKIRKMKLSVFDFIKIIRKYRDQKSKLMISNVHRVKGLTKGTVILYNWTHPDEHIKDLYVRYSRLVTQNKISGKDFEQLESNNFYDLDIGVKYKDIRNYIQYVNMLYVAITRARHTVITSSCKGLDIFNIQH